MAAASRQLFRESLLCRLWQWHGLPKLSRYGADGVWVGTLFVASEEAGAPPKHKEFVLAAGYDDIVRTLIYSGRPMSVMKTPYIAEWESQRQQELATLLSQGKVPHEVELEKHPNRSLEGRMCKVVLCYLVLSF